MLPVAARGVPTLLSGCPATLAADDLPISDIAVSRCTAELLYHRGSGPSLAGAGGGRGSVDVLCDRCHAVSGGRRSEAVPAELYQSGF